MDHNVTAYRFDRCEIRPTERRVLVDGRPAPLGARAFDLLLALVERRDRTVTKAELLDLVWPGLVVEENNLQVQISTLRKVLGQDAIATIPGQGYRFTLSPEEAAPSSVPPTAAANNTQSHPVVEARVPAAPVGASGPSGDSAARPAGAPGISPKKLRWAAFSATAILLVVLATLSWNYGKPALQTADTTVTSAGVTTPLHKPEEIGPEKLSLQVGEFKPSVPNDSEGSRIGKSLSQKIYLSLSPERHVLHIKSLPPGDATPAAGKPLARYVVEGVITPVTGGYRVDARLVGSQDRTTLWGDGFRLMAQSTGSIELGAHRIVHALHAEVFALEVKRTQESPPSRPDSLDLVLMGYAQLRAGDSGQKEARRLFERALELDPRNVPALLALALLSPVREQDRLTQDAVSKDPLCADSWAMRSEVLWRLGQSHAAREAVDRALRINPANGSAQIARDEQLMNEGQWTHVIRSLEDVEFEFAKSQGLLRGMLGNQCRARLLAERDAEDACNRWFATSGSEASLVYATAAMVRNRTANEALRAGARLKERHPGYTVAANRKKLTDSKNYSELHLAQLDKVVFSALVKAGVPEQ